MTVSEPVVLDTDTISLLARGEPRTNAHARAYLEIHGAFTITSISAFERLRGYRAALAAGRPFEEHLRRFEAFVATTRVLPFDGPAAERAAWIWASLSARRQKALADILIAAVAATHGLALVTRNRRDFAPIAALANSGLRLADWTA